MRLLVLSLFIPLAMVVLSYGQASVHIGGNDGLALLKNLTKSSSNLTVDNNLTNNTLINTTSLTETVNADGSNPFRQSHYLLLNLAIGANGGDPSKTTLPVRYEVDYVRVYKKR